MTEGYFVLVLGGLSPEALQRFRLVAFELDVLVSRIIADLRLCDETREPAEEGMDDLLFLQEHEIEEVLRKHLGGAADAGAGEEQAC